MLENNHFPFQEFAPFSGDEANRKFQNNYKQTQSLSLNIFEIETSKNVVQIFATQFEEGKLFEYEHDFKDYHFYRNKDKIYSWALTATPSKELPSKFQSIEIDRHNDTLIYNKILEQAVVSILKQGNIRHLRHSSTWEYELKSGSKDFQGLLIQPVLQFALYPLYSLKSKKLISALSIRIAQKFSFNISEEAIKAKNVDTRDWKRNWENKIIGHRANAISYARATNQYNDFLNFDSLRATDKYAYDELLKFHNHFNHHIRAKVFLPDDLKITQFLFHNLENSNFSSDVIEQPTYYFYQERTGGGMFNDRLRNLKPYNFDKFASDKAVQILVLTPTIHEGTTGEFITRLKNAFSSYFHLTNVTFDTHFVNTNQETFADVIDNRVQRNDYDLALVVMSEQDKKFSIPKSPYYTSKARLLNRRIPTQKVLIETIKKTDYKDMVLHAIALNIFSKMGGVAWAIEQSQKEKVEVVIGISSTIDSDKNRLIGFANVFDYNGNYLIGDCSHLSTKETYLENLRVYLVKIIAEIIKDKGVSKGEPIRLIFHLTKEAGKQTEIKAIELAIKQFSEYKIQFGIVHLSFNHNLRVYAGKGEANVKRGTFIQVSTLQALLHFGNKTKMPVLARLDQRSTYKDIYDISKQVLFFTHLCYRNFRPANVPVTIKYPSLMAKLTSELMQVDKWNEKELNNIKDLLWFI